MTILWMYLRILNNTGGKVTAAQTKGAYQLVFTLTLTCLSKLPWNLCLDDRKPLTKTFCDSALRKIGVTKAKQRCGLNWKVAFDCFGEALEQALCLLNSLPCKLLINWGCCLPPRRWGWNLGSEGLISGMKQVSVAKSWQPTAQQHQHSKDL